MAGKLDLDGLYALDGSIRTIQVFRPINRLTGPAPPPRNNSCRKQVSKVSRFGTLNPRSSPQQ